MKKIGSAILSICLLLTTSGVAFAAPFNAYDKNPQVVAYYPDGTHGIVGESATHTGKDLVMRTGSNGNFQQWFYGTSSEDSLHGDHSVWKESKDGTCPDQWDIVEDAYPEWGDYLTPNVNYCVHTNQFHPSN